MLQAAAGGWLRAPARDVPAWRARWRALLFHHACDGRTFLKRQLARLYRGGDDVECVYDIGCLDDVRHLELDKPAARFRPRAPQHQLGRGPVAGLRHFELLLQRGFGAFARQLIERAVRRAAPAQGTTGTARIALLELRHGNSRLMNGR
jgi:hypothetical protein